MIIGLKSLVALIAFEHLFIMWLEMFVWTTVGKKVFSNFPKDLFDKTKVLAANQGLYNGFLAAGLIWSLFIVDNLWSTNIAGFFLSCVIVAGIYGGITVKKSIFFTQALPSILVIGVLFIFR